MNKTGFKNKENKSQSAHSYDNLVLMVSFLPFLGAGERRKERTKTLGTRLIGIIVAVIFDDSRINKNHASCLAIRSSYELLPQRFILTHRSTFTN